MRTFAAVFVIAAGICVFGRKAVVPTMSVSPYADAADSTGLDKLQDFASRISHNNEVTPC